MEITELLAFALQNKASDIHLTVGNAAILRIDGELKPLRGEPLAADVVKTMIHSVMTEEQRTRYEEEREIDFTIAFGQSGRFRVNAFNTQAGSAAVLRAIPNQVPDLGSLNAPGIFRRLAELERGLEPILTEEQALSTQLEQVQTRLEDVIKEIAAADR